MVNYKHFPTTQSFPRLHLNESLNTRTGRQYAVASAGGVKRKTPSYEKHFLTHTDLTPTGPGYSYPHDKNFAWNLVFLKQSWGSNLHDVSRKPKYAEKSSSANQNGRTLPHSAVRAPSVAKTSHSVNVVTAVQNACTSAKSKSSHVRERQSSKATSRRTRHTCQRSRATLDSIPEDNPLTTRASDTKLESPLKNVAGRYTPVSRMSRCSTSTSSMYSSYYTSSLPTIPSESGRQSMSTNKSYTPAHSDNYAANDKLLSMRRSAQRRTELPAVFTPNHLSTDRVKCTIGPEKLKDIMRTSSNRLYVRSVPLVNNEPRRQNPVSATSMPFHKSLTKLNFQVVEAAKTTRLRSPLYRSEESNTRPSIFRSNDKEITKTKNFNPMFHGEITRPYMVHSFAHKNPTYDTKPSTRWYPQKSPGTQPWTIYDTKTR